MKTTEPVDVKQVAAARDALEAHGVLDVARAAFTPGWRGDAVCAQQGDPEAFYVDKGGSLRAARRMCMACPVIDRCRALSLLTAESCGLWGALSEFQRRKVRSAGTDGIAASIREARDLAEEHRPTCTPTAEAQPTPRTDPSTPSPGTTTGDTTGGASWATAA